MSAETKSDLRLEIAHVLFIDIVGYSKLLINEQHESLQELNQIVRGTEAFRAAETAGQLTRIPTGDGMALVFSTTPDAPVQCALEIGKALRSRPDLRVRMGIHSGPVSAVTDVNDHANIAGGGINMAQRVMDCGDAGHILLSKRVADDLAQYRQWQPHLHDLGECQVKHDVTVSVVNLYTDEAGNPALPARFARLPVAAGVSAARPKVHSNIPLLAFGVIALLIVGGAIWFFSRQPAARSTNATSTTPAPPTAAAPALPDKSIAVLPFDNLSSDKENAYFADGMQDEIITRLAKIGELRVISRSSTKRYRGRGENVAEIARQLGVAHLVEGSVQKIGDRVRINVQLLKAQKDEHLWAELYDRNLTDIFAVQSEVATAIAKSLQAKLSGHERGAVAEKPTENLAAYDAYLRGIDFYSRPGQTGEDQKKAVVSFEEAVRLDPKFTQAWAALAKTNAGLYFLQIDASPARKEAARKAAQAATQLDPNAAETLLANAYYRYHIERDYNGARELFEKLRREVPSSSKAVEALAQIARRQSRWKESLRLYEEAANLNPRDAHLFMDRAWTFSMLRDYSATEEMIDRALAIVPDDPDVLVNKAWLYRTMGNLPAARAVLDKIPATAKSEDANQARVNLLMLERRYDEAARLLEQKLARMEGKPPSEGGGDRELLGWLRSLAGDKEGARQAYLEGKAQLELLQQQQPRNYSVVSALAFCEAGLGNKEAALREGERAVSLLPASEDPVYGPIAEETLAGIEAQVGELERAIARIERLLVTPYGAFPLTQATLRLDPLWDPLREHPRFKAIVEGPEPKTIYK
jgi:TolB-like protein/class 3 adenylate cyclase/Tfp pilus assembly protein PilF